MHRPSYPDQSDLLKSSSDQLTICLLSDQHITKTQSLTRPSYLWCSRDQEEEWTLTTTSISTPRENREANYPLGKKKKRGCVTIDLARLEQTKPMLRNYHMCFVTDICRWQIYHFSPSSILTWWCVVIAQWMPSVSPPLK